MRNDLSDGILFFKALYSDVRQLITYIKEGHGSVFRRVALSALLDTADRPSKKEPNVQTTRVIRHIHHSTDIDDQDIPPDASISMDEKSVRKLLFKKRSTSSTCAVNTISFVFIIVPKINQYLGLLFNAVF